MIEAVTSGIDWLTATLPLYSAMDNQWVERALRHVDAVVADGHRLEYARLNGYDGVRSGGCFVGSRFDGHMVQFSGAYADMVFDEVYRPDAHFSRLDLQTTVKYRVMPKRVAKDAYRDAITENETISVARRRKVYIIVGSDGGDTCYVGSPSSDERGRIYNKEVQSEDILYMRTWRYEVVLKNDKATVCAGSIPKRATTRPQFVSDYCGHWWEKRGITVPWLLAQTPLPICPVRTVPTDIERKLNWLKHQVRPTIEYLLTVQDKESILALLGLS